MKNALQERKREREREREREGERERRGRGTCKETDTVHEKRIKDRSIVRGKKGDLLFERWQ